MRSPGKCLQKFFRKLSGVLQDKTNLAITFARAKNSAVLEPRTGHIRELAGFEAKAKDFKLCPRGRSRGHQDILEDSTSGIEH